MTLLQQHAENIQTRGYSIIENALTSAEVSAAKDALESIFAREAAIAESRGWLTEMYRVSYMLSQKHALFRELPLNPRVLEVAREVLGQTCVLASLNGLAMIPRGSPQNLHIDAFESTPGVTCYINALHCLDDFTRANGCTRVIPGSTRRMWNRQMDMTPFEPETVYIEAPAGSVIAYDGGLWHAGSGNATDNPRRAIHVFYSRSWVCPQWDYRTSLSDDVKATMTPEQRKLFALDRFANRYDVVNDIAIKCDRKVWR